MPPPRPPCIININDTDSDLTWVMCVMCVGTEQLSLLDIICEEVRIAAQLLVDAIPIWEGLSIKYQQLFYFQKTSSPCINYVS